ncbi:hypothetical protein T265_00063 [Opisthorchis viverrini]|uniref:Uncharacterized protein n=1 Tax=Opisthorchis viverrini TaxID=6198 RepID=A0A075ADH2_OPIVI|nr:hypothetical protein T265_00063 [Opisthorchis viverrini]KER34200.1 hypothetical protein T265_00063 [Opisthorchis viverrini]
MKHEGWDTARLPKPRQGSREVEVGFVNSRSNHELSRPHKCCNVVILSKLNTDLTQSGMGVRGCLAICTDSAICSGDRSPRPKTITFSKSTLCPVSSACYSIIESFSNAQYSPALLGGLFILHLFSPILVVVRSSSSVHRALIRLNIDEAIPANTGFGEAGE